MLSTHFVSYYDYYQPEAYVPQTDAYIEKDASINDEIDRLRHAATSALSSGGMRLSLPVCRVYTAWGHRKTMWG